MRSFCQENRFLLVVIDSGSGGFCVFCSQAYGISNFTHMHAHVCAHPHMHVRARMRARTHTHTHVHVHVCTHACMLAHTVIAYYFLYRGDVELPRQL